MTHLQVHFLHVIPVPMPAVVGGLGGLDTGLVTVDPDPREDVKHIVDAKEFIKRRFITKVATKDVAYKVEIVHFLTDNDSIGEAVVKRADALKAAAVVMAKHQRGAISEFFLGSVTKVPWGGVWERARGDGGPGILGRLDVVALKRVQGLGLGLTGELVVAVPEEEEGGEGLSRSHSMRGGSYAPGLVDTQLRRLTRTLAMLIPRSLCHVCST